MNNLSLASMFTDHMVLQQQTTVPIWGKGPEGTTVTVSIQDQAVSSVVYEGKWSVRLAPLQAGGPYELSVRLEEARRSSCSEIYLSDVWVGEVWLAGGQSNMVQPLMVVEGGIEAAAKADNPCIRFFTTPRRPFHGARVPGWDFIGTISEDTGWQVCSPETALHFTGIGVLYAKHLQEARGVPIGIISCNWGGTPAQAWMSDRYLERDPQLKPILDVYKEYISNQNSDAYEGEHDRYMRDMYQMIEQRGDIERRVKELGLDGYRKWITDHPLIWPDQPYGPKSPERPCGLYETMLQTVIPYAIRGVLWYQGESNAKSDEASRYEALLTGLIANWREEWCKPDLPFLIVQLTAFAPSDNPDGDTWSIIREAQEAVVNKVPNTSLIVTIDCGDPHDIHPIDKSTVAERLALSARAMVYGEQISHQGPRYLAMNIDGPQILISFDVDGEQPNLSAGPLIGFEICGEDRQFVPADARFVNHQIEVSSLEIEVPIAVRYAWGNMPTFSVVGNNGIPAAPFRTNR